MPMLMGTSKNSGSTRADQRDQLQQLEWMEPKATLGPIFRGALMSIPMPIRIPLPMAMFGPSMFGPCLS